MMGAAKLQYDSVDERRVLKSDQVFVVYLHSHFF